MRLKNVCFKYSSPLDYLSHQQKARSTSTEVVSLSNSFIAIKEYNSRQKLKVVSEVALIQTYTEENF